MGDSTRLSYQHEVRAMLQREDLPFEVELHWPESASDSCSQIIDELHELIPKLAPDVVHVNTGHGDLERLLEPDGRWHHRVDLADFRRQLWTVLELIQAHEGVDPVFSTLTPVSESLEPRWSPEDIETCNIVIQEVMLTANVLIDPLDEVLLKLDQPVLESDGMTLTPEAVAEVAHSVSQRILECLL